MTEIFQDIRKTYNFFRPVELADFVEFYGETCDAKTELFLKGQAYTIKMFPSWTPTFYINLGRSYKMSIGKQLFHIRRESDVLILRDRITERFNHPDDHIFITKFYPGGLESVLGMRQSEMTEPVYDLRQVLPPVLIQQIKTAACFQDRVKILNAHLLSCCTKRAVNDHYIKMIHASVSSYMDSGMLLNTSELAERHFLSSKTINRYFQRKIGVSPKKYFSVLRARTALIDWVQDPGKFDPCDYGYYDRSHFQKEVVRFTEARLPPALL
ncbi:AraC family transcriptional regulator [Niabella sp.]|uniref:AraC family transcriptional regulator n=1 Tax=Niabella sp. TaxID=1962976 RepID=UPI0026073D19|nr:AraC family transcriptional regulator [Niabella sp.]